MKKYELTNETYADNPFIGTLYRIRALRDFGNIKKGALGGFVKSDDNLSHEGNCWVWDAAQVYGNARVSGDAQILDCAVVSADAKVYGNARISKHANVFGHAEVFGNAHVTDYARVSGEKTRVFGDAWIFGAAHVKYDEEISSGIRSL